MLGCSLGASAMLFAADGDAPTAADLLQQGISQYKQGDLDAARQTLLRVDPAQLTDKEQRVELTQTIQDIDRLVADRIDPQALLAEAEQALKAGHLDRAAAIYSRVSQSDQASASQKQLAQARLAGIRRESRPADERSARASLNEGVADIQNNRLADAARKLQAVKASGIDLGWFDNQRLDRALALINEREAELAQAAKAAAEEAAKAAEAEKAAQAQKLAAEEAAKAEQAAAAQANETAQPAAAAPQQSPAPKADADVLAQAINLASQEKVALARAAEAEGNHRLAVQHYEEALAIQPSNADARNGLAAAQVRAQQVSRSSSPTVLQQQISGMDLRGQAALAEYNQLINLAQNHRKGLNYAAANEATQQARIILDNNAQYLPAAEYRRLREETVLLASTINDEKIQFEQQEKERVSRDQEAQALETARQAAERQQEEVYNLLRRAQALRKEQNYDRALQLVNQALFLDRNNYAAQAMKDIIEDSIILTRAHQANRQKAINIAKHRVDNIEATIPPTELLIYPPDWPQLTARRLADLGQDGSDTEANRIVRQKLREQIPAEFSANQLETALNFIRQITGVNILVNWSAMQMVGVERDTPISLQLSNIPAGQALKYILQDASSYAGATTNQVKYAVYDGLVHISTEDDLKTTTIYTRVYDIRDLLIRVPNFTEAPTFELSSVMQSTSSGSGGGSSQSLFSDSDEDDDDEEEQREELILQITDLIQSMVGKPEDWPNAGGLLSSITELNGNLIIRTTPDNHRATLDLLNELRETRAMQISIEARFLLVDRQFVNDFGVDFDMTIHDLGSKFGPISIAQNSFVATENLNSILGGNPALTLGASFLQDLEVNLMIRATQADQRSVQLTAPRLTLFNGQRSYVVIATQTSFVSDLEVVPDGAGFNPTVSVVNEGVVLDVEATITADRRYVTMTVRPSLARLVRLDSIEFTAANTANTNNNNGTREYSTGLLQMPILEINQVRTTVSVPDKGTILLGGQRIVNEREIEIGVPVLSKVPLLNRLFTNRSIDKLDRTLLILIKPTIIIQNEEEENLFPGLNANPQQFNIGRRAE